LIVVDALPSFTVTVWLVLPAELGVFGPYRLVPASVPLPVTGVRALPPVVVSLTT
jgi:hypothetical protein